MHAVEFQTRITDGIIEIPADLKDKVSGQVRVILLTEELPGGEDLIEQLLLAPVSLPHFESLTRDELHERP